MQSIRKTLLKIALFTLLVYFVQNSIYAQQITQTIKGTVYDRESHTPIPGANIIIPGTNPVMGAVVVPNISYKIEF